MNQDIPSREWYEEPDVDAPSIDDLEEAAEAEGDRQYDNERDRRLERDE